MYVYILLHFAIKFDSIWIGSNMIKHWKLG